MSAPTTLPTAGRMTRAEVKDELDRQGKKPFAQDDKILFKPMLAVGGDKLGVLAGDFLGTSPIVRHLSGACLGKSDYLTYSDFFQGVFAFGETGSGKTSGFHTIADAFLRSGMGGLVLAAKADEPENFKRWVIDAGREKDLVIIGQGEHEHKLNIFDSEMASDLAEGEVGVSKVENVVMALCAAGEGGADDSKNSGFFKKAMMQLLRSILTLVHKASGEITVDNIYKFMFAMSKYSKYAQGGGEPFEIYKREPDLEKNLYLLLKSYLQNYKDDHNVKVSVDYIIEEYIMLPPETMSGINSTLSGIIDKLRREPLRSVLCGKTTIPLEAARLGKIFLIGPALAVKEANDIGKVAQTLIKRSYQRVMERVLRGTPVFLYCDECQEFMTDYDAQFQATARTSRCATIYMTQNLPGLNAAMGSSAGEGGRAAAIIGNLTTKFLFLNSDPQTNEWSSKLIGKKIRRTRSGGKTSSGGLGGGSSSNDNWSESQDFDCREMEYHRLRHGGKQHKGYVDAVLFKTGKSWAGGARWKKVTFSQKTMGQSEWIQTMLGKQIVRRV